MLFQEYYETALRLGWFDPCFYLDELQAHDLTVADAGLSLFEHFATIGWKRGLSPSDRFSVAQYLAHYQDVTDKQVDPLYHYLVWGQREHRKAFPLFEARHDVQFIGLCRSGRQLALARLHGMSAVCMHYDGCRERDVFDQLDRDTSFCLFFDLENGAARGSGPDGDTSVDRYGALQAVYSCIHDVLGILSDARYLRVAGKPLLVVYRPERLKNARLIFELWREVARRAGLGGLYVTGLPFHIEPGLDWGLDGLIDAQISPQTPGQSSESGGFGEAALDYPQEAEQCASDQSATVPVFPGFIPDLDRSPRKHLSFETSAQVFRTWLTPAAERTRALASQGSPLLAFIDARNGWADGSQEFLTQAGPAPEQDHRPLAKLRHLAEAMIVSSRLPVLFLCDETAGGGQNLMQRLIESMGQFGRIECFLVVDSGAPTTDLQRGAPAINLRELKQAGWSREQAMEVLAGLLRARGDVVVVSGTLATADLLAPFAARDHRIVSFVHDLPAPGELAAGGPAFGEIGRRAHRIIVGSESVRRRISVAGAIPFADIEVIQPGLPTLDNGYVEEIRDCLLGLGNEGRRIRLTGGTVGRQEIADDLCVVIPSYNHKRFILAAVDSILAQSVRPREIRIIDDGSNDGSAELVSSLASDKLGIFVEVRENRGAHTTINQGIAETECPIVAVMNSDDRWHPLRIEELIGDLRRPTGADVVFSRLRFIDPERQFDHKLRWYESGVADYKKGSPLWLSLLFCNFFFTTSNLIARREKFLEVGGFGPLRYCHDLDYMLKAILAGHKVQFVEQSLCDYRFHARNTIDENMQKLLFEEAWIIAKFLRANYEHISEAEWSIMAERIADKGLATRVLGVLQATVRNEAMRDDTLIYSEPLFGAIREHAGRHRAQDAVGQRELVHEIKQLLLEESAEATTKRPNFSATPRNPTPPRRRRAVASPDRDASAQRR